MQGGTMYGKLNAPRVIPDRDAATRVDPRAALADDRGRYLLVRGEAVPFDGRLVFLTRREVTAFRASPAYLGLVDGVPYFALDATLAADVGGQRLAELPFVSLRSVGHLLNDAEATLALEAIALVNWHAAEFCPTCGAPATLVAAGWQMTCPAGHSVFPRTDPAVIMAIHDADDRLLLGRNRSWPKGRLSALAGFVEAGETLEDAVRREVFEECAVRVARLEYFASQPWPFPRSLMVGFHGWAAEPHPSVVPDGLEIVEAAFFTREQVRRMQEENPEVIPGPTSLARALIEDWLAQTCEETA
ncbi:NAD(+) diphosphatase [Trueperella pyogenes]|nr:NAD(+) diphosphatase [Trueperella pyogenes]AZR03068.1 NAD(+) diphosphatase [Trueperella pyogenes]